MRDPLTLAVALQARDRHAVTLSITCRFCLPPGTRWPCQPWRTADAIVARLGAIAPPPPIHPDWLDPPPDAR